MIPEQKRFDLEYIVNILQKEGLIGDEEKTALFLQEDRIRARLYKKLKGSKRNQKNHISLEISPLEIVEEMGLETKNKSGKIDQARVLRLVSKNLGIPFVEIDPLKLDPELVTSIISEPFALKHSILPLGVKNGTLTLASSNPFIDELVENLEKITGFKVNVVLATKSDIVGNLSKFFRFRRSVQQAQKTAFQHTQLGDLEQLIKIKSIDEIDASDTHIVNAVDFILHYSLEQRASDIHIEPKREISKIRFRIDGVLHDIDKIPKVVHLPILSRIKLMAGMDIAEKRKPQDGRIKMQLSGKEVELRVSTLPTAFGEKLVIRIFDPEVLSTNLEDLGMTDSQLKIYKDFLSRRHGLILITGPTGSGKTTTLYSTLSFLNSSQINIVTIEDPIEMVIEDFNQINVQPKIGLDFAESLRTILRQDPDVIMVGEIRDPETARQTVQAALTGHLVFSTVHTNDTVATISRMMELGVDPPLLAGTLIGVIAQRLVRKVCPYCIDYTYLTSDQISLLGLNTTPGTKLKVAYGRGCRKCRNTGYFGRTGIFEILQITKEIAEAIKERKHYLDIFKLAREYGMSTMKENAIKKLARGVTTFEEVIRTIYGAI